MSSGKTLLGTLDPNKYRITLQGTIDLNKGLNYTNITNQELEKISSSDFK